MMNGIRNPINGRGDEPDVESERFTIESKEREDGVPKWIEDAVAQAVKASEIKSKLPLVLIHKKGDEYKSDLAVMRFQDFEQIIDDRYLNIGESFEPDPADVELGEEDDSVLYTLEDRLLQMLELCEIWRSWTGDGRFSLADLPAATIVRGRRKAKKHPLVRYITQMGIIDLFPDESVDTQTQYAAHIVTQARLQAKDMTEYIALLETVRVSVDAAAYNRLEDAGLLFYTVLDAEQASFVDYAIEVVQKEG